MSLNAKKTEAGLGKKLPEQDLLDVGGYNGRLVQVIDLGLQTNEFKGESKPPVQKFYTTYELVDEFCKDEDGNYLEDKPRWFSETMPLYNLEAEKAKSTERYLALDPNRVKEGNWPDLLGDPVVVTIIRKVSKKDGKERNYIGATSAMRPKMAEGCPPLINEARVFTLDNPDLEVFNNLPKWLQETITGNLEYSGSKLEQMLEGATTKEASAEEASEEVEWETE